MRQTKLSELVERNNSNIPNKKVLVACEESQAVTIELRNIGIEAYSCDILPCSGGHPEWHLQQDVTPLVNDPKWSMILAFPPCDHICVSGAKWFEIKKKDGRQQQGIDFFMMFANSICPRVSIENPVGIMSSIYRKPDQIIQPYYFGDPYPKKTCLWLKGLPLLAPTNIVDYKDDIVTFTNGRKMSRLCSNTPKKDRGRLRSKTFNGIAKAMADQYGRLLL